MYSLYRAWLMRDAVTAGLATPPDVIILVGSGNEQFLAHRQLVSLHSGYLKSLLYDSNSTSIAVPNVLPEAFGPLLTFMYTGYLHLDASNIYSILLATHLLHMPRALEICREYLVQSSTPISSPAPPTIIKPIPSRKAISLSPPQWAPSAPAFHTPILLRPTPDGPFRSVTQATTTSSELPTEQETTAVPETSTITTTTVPSGSPSPTFTFLKASKKIKKVNDENKESVVDVACCDGPVQFYRVLNECYTTADGEEVHRTSDEPSTSTETTVNKPDNPHLHNSNLIQLRKALEKNVESADSESYICGYCSHAFKSQFCYEKHVRRHINHVEKARARASENGQQVSRRQVRLLDMNVQYYPCKTCGSKFPSYYFVHKHRKLCHSGEEDIQSSNISVKDTADSSLSTATP